MRKSVLIMIVILIALSALLYFLGSGGEYNAERLLFSAMVLNRKIIANPDVAPPALLATVEDRFQKVLKRYPKSAAATRASIALVEFYIAHKKYDKALLEIDAIEKDSTLERVKKANHKVGDCRLADAGLTDES